jgi:hypothetical protein
MFSVPAGKPGVVANYDSQPREVFYSGREFAQFFAPPATVDGTNSSNPNNGIYPWLLWAGMPMGRVSSTNKYATSIIGLSTVALTTSATTLQTTAAAATEVQRRIGGSGTLALTGPPAASGAVASSTVTFSAVNTSTGAITITATSVAFVSGSLIQPTDGSQAITTLLCETNGLQVVDQLHATRVDVFCGRLLAGGGTINTGMIVDYPSDPSLKAYVKAAIKSGAPSATFLDDVTG